MSKPAEHAGQRRCLSQRNTQGKGAALASGTRWAKALCLTACDGFGGGGFERPFGLGGATCPRRAETGAVLEHKRAFFFSCLALPEKGRKGRCRGAQEGLLLLMPLLAVVTGGGLSRRVVTSRPSSRWSWLISALTHRKAALCSEHRTAKTLARGRTLTRSCSATRLPSCSCDNLAFALSRSRRTYAVGRQDAEWKRQRGSGRATKGRAKGTAEGQRKAEPTGQRKDQ